MKARLIQDQSDTPKLLCTDGTILNFIESNDVFLILSNFKYITEFSGNDGHWFPKYMDMALYPGKTLAYVTDEFLLVVIDPSTFKDLLSSDSDLNSYVSLAEYAESVNKSQQIIKVFCREGRLPGAKKMGGRWMIPKGTPYPGPPSRRHD